jgi:hypothetical protein
MSAPQLRCPLCGSIFPNLARLKGHLCRATDYRLHCRDCPATYVEMAELIRHREAEHEPKRQPNRGDTGQ